jgi:large subunit ribosomal protein L15
MLKLSNLQSPKGAHRNIKRIGRGQGSGQGCQAGKGHKGQKARKSGHVRSGFEGGNLPLYMRLPKRGFSNARFKTEYAVLNIEQLEAKFDAGEVSRETLIERKLLKGRERSLPIKVLGKGKVTKAFTFKGIKKFSGSAAEQIKAAGGSVEESK